ncbi:hypothetical protein L484_011722 [Morus notabilis]|uniref:Uncharacterized protein n=1 Tax=Morus notabilis TaxID=981085 RepID=W9RRU0_9ROSA|nr:hypothetical protein L484_011722 [Morus notabilis]
MRPTINFTALLAKYKQAWISDDSFVTLHNQHPGRARRNGIGLAKHATQRISEASRSNQEQKLRREDGGSTRASDSPLHGESAGSHKATFELPFYGHGSGSSSDALEKAMSRFALKSC